jgi:hypothetical protein
MDMRNREALRRFRGGPHLPPDLRQAGDGGWPLPGHRRPDAAGGARRCPGRLPGRRRGCPGRRPTGSGDPAWAGKEITVQAIDDSVLIPWEEVRGEFEAATGARVTIVADPIGEAFPRLL